MLITCAMLANAYTFGAMTENGADPVLPGIDTSTPNTARVYDYLLGGTNSFPADRAMADELLRLIPDTGQRVRENREFLGRAVRYLATTEGITQFLDIGSGLPTNDNVHQITQRITADSQVVYVDHDPMVVRHAELLLAGTGGVTVFRDDVRNPGSVLDQAGAMLDLSQPVALLLVAILHFIPDADGPREIVRQYLDALAPGSYLVLTHASAPASTPVAQEAAVKYNSNSAGSFTLRTDAGIGAFFDGLDLLEPGLVYAGAWRPDAPSQTNTDLGGFLAGVGAKG